MNELCSVIHQLASLLIDLTKMKRKKEGERTGRRKWRRRGTERQIPSIKALLLKKRTEPELMGGGMSVR